MPTESENTVNARLLKLEIEARQDRQALRDHLVAAEQAARDSAAQRSGDFDRHRIERQADMEKAERERDQIKALIESNKRLIEDNTRAIHDANLAGKILVKLAAIVVGAPVTVYGIIKVVQELFPPRAPLHAVAFYLVLSAIIFSALPALSATYYVAPSGSNTAAGTISAPWATINYAATRVAPGDVVIAKDGTYRESVRTTISGTTAASITYRADNPGQAKLAPPANNSALDAWEQAGAYVTVSGFDVDGSAHLSGQRWARGITVSGQHSTVTLSTVHDIGRAAACGDAGYGIGVTGAYTTIHANTVRDIGPAGGC